MSGSVPSELLLLTLYGKRDSAGVIRVKILTRRYPGQVRVTVVLITRST